MVSSPISVCKLRVGRWFDFALIVYFFRWILHNQSDKYAIKLLENLIPALKKGSKIVINDHCLPEPGQESLWDEKIIR
jgi:hypothetical protein